MAEEPSAAALPDAPTPTPKTVEASLEPVIKDLPEPTQREIVRVVEQQFMAVVRSGMAGPQIDPETAKILADTLQKDNENKFQYLIRKQADAAAQQERADGLASAQHKDLARPIVWAAVSVTVLTVLAGLYFIAIGKDAIGGGLISGIFGALLGFLGGLGTAGHLQRK